jgi:hypothetical protein
MKLNEVLIQKMNNFKVWVNTLLQTKDIDDAKKDIIRNKINMIPNDCVMIMAVLTKLFTDKKPEDILHIYRIELQMPDDILTEEENIKFKKYIECFYELYKMNL